MQPLFGSCLSTSLARCSHMTSEGYLIPAILAICFNEIEERGLELEGLFRKSGSTAIVNQLQLEFEQNNNPFLIKFPYTISSHSLAGLFKRYLQLLPDPVIPKGCQKQFLQVYDENIEPDVLKQRLKHLICAALPLEHLHLFQFLVSVADKIQRNQEKNQMTIESLAIIFAPTCIHITQQETVPKKVFLQKAKRLFKKKKQTYQDLLQLDLIKDNVKWTKLFELILSDPSIFANLTNNKIKSPPMLPIMLEKTHTSRSAATTIDSTSFWNRAEYEKLEFITSHELLSNFEGFELDIPSLGGNEKHAAAQQ